MKPKLIILDCRSIQDPAINGVIKVGRNFLKDFRKHANSQKRLLIWTNSLKKRDLDFIKAKKYIVHIHTRIPNIVLHLIFKFLPFVKIDGLLYKLANFKSKDYCKNTQKFYFGFDLRSINLSSKVQKKSQYIHDVAFEVLKENLSFKAKMFYFLINPKKTIQKMDQIITNSEFSKKEIYKVFGHKNIKVIEPGLKRSLPEYKLAKIQKEDYILCISSKDPRKNLKQLLKISKNHPQEKFILVCNDFDYYQKENINLNFQVLENQTEEKIQELIKKAKACIYLSKYEGFGMPIYESIQNYTPIIVNKVKHYIKTFKKENLSIIENNQLPQNLNKITKNNLYVAKHQARKLIKSIVKL